MSSKKYVRETGIEKLVFGRLKFWPSLVDFLSHKKCPWKSGDTDQAQVELPSFRAPSVRE